jgi:glycosyltransferase involved in cell wall biosynthesis
MSCKRFSKGCGECPDLERAFAVGQDHTRFNRKIKQEYFKDGYTLHIASNWFADYVKENTGNNFPSPVVLPFGLDVERFSGANKLSSIQKSTQTNGKITIGIRAVREAQKNFDLFRNALIDIKNPERFRIVTLQEKGMLAGLDSRIDIEEIGWTNSPGDLESFFTSIDVFVMPSLFETFGFMALEAMSSGVPVIGVGGTAVDEVCDLDTTGYKITGHSSFELQCILSNLTGLADELSIKSRLGIERVNENFDLEKFCQSMKIMYSKAIEEFNIAKN